MKKKKRKKNGNFSKSKLFTLILAVFRKNPNKKLNYKELSKKLAVKEMGVKIQIIDVMKEMSLSGVLSEDLVGSFRLAEKTSTVISIIKNTNSRGGYAEIGAGTRCLFQKNMVDLLLLGMRLKYYFSLKI